DSKRSGASVGLYLVARSATTLTFNAVPELATEVIATFDLQRASEQLAQLAYLVEPTDVTNTLASGRPRVKRPRLPLIRRNTIAGGVAALAVIGGVVTWTQLRTTPTNPAIVLVESQPAGASVAIDGRIAGTTPLQISSLSPGTTISLVLERRGYLRASA